MSLIDARVAIRDAVDGITGLHVSLERPGTIVAGSTWPVWKRSSTITQGVDEDQWDLIVVQSDGSVSLEAAMALRDTIKDAINASPDPIVYEYVEPGRLAPEDGAVPALRFRIRSAS